MDSINTFANRLANHLAERLVREKREATLRMSNIGKPCERQLWYEMNTPEEGEPLRPETFMKFLYGDIIEELVLFLAELAGHEVTGRQDEQEVSGIKGHRDAVIDGTLVDVKSASSFSFKKFKAENGLTPEGDGFGYLTQLQSYLEAAQEDDAVQNKTQAAFLVVDKGLGHLALDIKERDTTVNWPEFFERKKQIISSEVVPERGFEDEVFGASGNKKLGFNCSYCPFKKTCWPDSRTFLYSYGPVTLSKVVREPGVPEIVDG